MKMKRMKASSQSTINIKTGIPLEMYAQWKALCPNGHKQRQLILPYLKAYIKGDLHPNDMPYFTTLPKGTAHEQIAMRLPYGFKKALDEKLHQDYIPVAGLLRSIIQIIINQTNETIA